MFIRSTTCSINLNLSIYVVDKEQTRSKAQGACKNEEGKANDPHVAKVQENRDKFCDFKLGIEIEDGVEKHVECT